VFVGRHPFAGRFRGEGDLLIEQAIAERRFAFSRDSEETLVEPPPYSLQMSDLPSGLTDLFETAFRLGGLNGTLRPSPAQWVKQLEALMAQRTVCDLDDLHIYYSGLKACPWCRIENDGGPSFFVKESGSSFVSDGRLALLDAKINALRPIPFPDLPPSLITPPEGVATKETGERPKLHKPDLAALAMVAGAVLCVGGAFHGAAYVTGLVLVLASGGYLLLGPPCKARRMAILQFDQQLRQLRLQMLQFAQKVTIVYQKRKQQFDANMTELRTTVQRYCSEGDQLKEILQEQAGAQKNHFLRSHLIRDHVADIPGLTEGLIPMLESYGVESALDAHKLGIYGVPSLSPDLAIELLQWRQLVEQQFKFKPEHGITTQDLERSQQLATQRFKMAQARKILIGAQHLDSLAVVGKATVRRSARDFEVLSQKWKKIARKKHATQQQRTKLERSLNASVTTVTTALIAIPIVGGLLALLLR
jgi:DNA-binding helix-hairpin-helix protein with protein kinase domain